MPVCVFLNLRIKTIVAFRIFLRIFQIKIICLETQNIYVYIRNKYVLMQQALKTCCVYSISTDVVVVSLAFLGEKKREGEGGGGLLKTPKIYLSRSSPGFFHRKPRQFFVPFQL